MRPLERLRSTGWIALVVGGALVPCLAVLGAGKTLSWRDTERVHAPLRPLVVDALRDLGLPLWNPHEALGMPLFAQLMHGVLHPVSVLAAWLAPGAGMDVFIVAYVALAAAGAALLARSLGASPGAAAVAGLGFGLSGYVLGASGNLVYLAASGTAPWAVAAMRQAGVGRGPGGIALAGAAVATLHFAGDPEWTAVALVLGLILAAEAAGLRGLGRAAGALALGTLVAAVQLWPTWALARETARAGGLDVAERTQWSLSPWRLVELAAPGFFSGRPGVSVRPAVFAWLGGATRHSQTLPFNPSVHVGGALLALAVAGVGAGRRGVVLALSAGALLWAALGRALGADQLLHGLPVWGSFRYPEKLVGPLTLCLALLAAFGCDRLAGLARERTVAAVGVAAGACGIAAAALFAWGQGLEELFGSPVARAGAAEARRQLATGLLHPAVALAALAAILALRRAAPLAGRIAVAAAGVVFVEALAAAPFALHAGVRGVRDEAPLRVLAAVPRPVRIVTPTDAGPFRVRVDLDDADALLDASSAIGAAPYAVPSGIDQLNVYTALASSRIEDLGRAFVARLGPEAWIAYRRYAVTHAVVTDLSDPDARAAVVGGTLVQADPERGFQLFAVPHRPWASFAPAVVSVAGGRAAIDAVIDLERRGDPAVVIEDGSPPVGAGTVMRVVRGREDVHVEARSPGPATLVLNDAYWPGWTARLDGVPVPVYRADALVRAVAWPAGRHELELRYEPREVRAGMAVSLAAALATLALAAAAVRRAARLRSLPAPRGDGLSCAPRPDRPEERER